MTSKIKILYAQALDNTSLNPMMINGNLLNDENKKERQDIALILSLISKNITKSRIHDGIKLIESKRNGFIFEVPCLEKDISGRNTSIIYCENSNFVPSEEFLNSVQKEMLTFSKITKRNINVNKILFFLKTHCAINIEIFLFLLLVFLQFYFLFFSTFI